MFPGRDHAPPSRNAVKWRGSWPGIVLPNVTTVDLNHTSNMIKKKMLSLFRMVARMRKGEAERRVHYAAALYLT